MRIRSPHSLVPAGLAAALLLAVAPAASAQQQVVPLSDLPRVEQDRIMMENQSRVMDSDRLYQEGKAYVEKGEWKKAASRFEQAAERRGDGDMKTAKLYRKAADAYYFAGKSGRAVSNFERAASSAMGFGDIDMAAESYLRAALVSHEAGDAVRANDNGWKAQRLSGSTALSPTIRTAIRQHLIVGDAAVALGG